MKLHFTPESNRKLRRQPNFLTSYAGKGGSVEHIVGPYYSGAPGLPFGLANIVNVGNTGGSQSRPFQSAEPFGLCSSQ